MNEEQKNNQTPVETKVRKFAIPDIKQEPIRTFEKDMASAMARLNNKKPPVENKVEEKKPIEKVPPEKSTVPFEQAVKEIDTRQKDFVPGVIETPPVKKDITYEEALAKAQAKREAIVKEVVDHPMQILHNQVDPELKIKKLEIPKKVVNTYEDDVAHAFSDKKASLLRMAVAENERKTGEESIYNKVPQQSGKKFALILGSVIFIAAGFGFGFYLYKQSPLATVPIDKTDLKPKGIVKSDSQKNVNMPILQKREMVQFVSNLFKENEINPNKITEFIISQTSSSTTIKLTGSEFINIMAFDITDTLKRSLTDKWMIGIYSTNEENHPFILLTTDFFQNAFAGMLKWENSMPNELADLLNFRENHDLVGSFRDKVIMNRDIREFINRNGETLLLYTFIDKDTLLITTAEEVVPAILNRIENQTYIR